MIDRNQLRNIDWVLIGLLVLNSMIGVAFIHSSSDYIPGNYALKQFFWILVSLVALLLFLSVDYRFFVAYSLYFYIIIVFILAGILLFGRLTAGAKSWIVLPFFQIQPSEIAKITVILVIAYIFSDYKRDYLSIGQGYLSSVIVFIPVLLIALQPDLGTALTYVPILLAAFFLAGLGKKTIIIFLILALLAGIVGWNLFLQEYQKERITTLVSPEKDPLGAGYHTIQSKIAIGSGGFLGKGYKRGTQSQLRFLPARHTDFIFSVIGEEFGFIGVITALLFYFLFLARLFQSVTKSRDRAGVYIIFMVAVTITFQFCINVLMTIGLFPIAGVPLPLISYGGSSLLTNYIAVSLVLNIKMRRFVNV
ncbi:MAG: rod shape-determining protein RodA [Candidatus Aminicenantes bacterium]|nr:rod shape-determining protein RodA [Candidatus Aminicenantes bacterium]MDH5385965.1 rod shape-determining protein RodA [Candidatus Aminicenantes bacterium]